MNTSDQQDKYLLSVISRTDGTRKSADNLSNLEEVKEAVSELVVGNDNYSVFVYKNSQDNPTHAGHYSKHKLYLEEL